MEKYNYLEQIKEDVRNFIEENNITVTVDNREEIEEQLNDMLWNDDPITRNETEIYFRGRDRAGEEIELNWDLLGEGVEDFGDE